MIGGYILDTGALRQLALGRPYISSVVIRATRNIQALYIPTTALATALSNFYLLPDQQKLLTDIVRGPVFTLHYLDGDTAVGVTALHTDIPEMLDAAHTVHLAALRPGLPVLTSRAVDLKHIHPGIETIELP